MICLNLILPGVGGETDFPVLGLSVTPKKGTAWLGVKLGFCSPRKKWSYGNLLIAGRGGPSCKSWLINNIDQQHWWCETFTQGSSVTCQAVASQSVTLSAPFILAEFFRHVTRKKPPQKVVCNQIYSQMCVWEKIRDSQF